VILINSTEYYTHQEEDPSKKQLANICETIGANILLTNFGYSISRQGKWWSWVLSLMGPLKELVGGNVMWLKASERGRLLDIGCGNGYFLVQMRDLGWDVVGVEPDPKAVKVARDHFGLRVFQGTLEEAKFPDDSFDVITMNHVIEHVPDPIGLLSECRRILKPNGKLVVVTPNIKSLGRYLFGKSWVHWDPPRHLFLFSSKSLRTCAEKAGLKVQRLWTPAKGALWMWMTSRLIKCDGFIPGGLLNKVSLRLKMEMIMFWTVEYIINRFRYVGEELALEASK